MWVSAQTFWIELTWFKGNVFRCLVYGTMQGPCLDHVGALICLASVPGYVELCRNWFKLSGLIWLGLSDTSMECLVYGTILGLCLDHVRIMLSLALVITKLEFWNVLGWVNLVKLTFLWYVKFIGPQQGHVCTIQKPCSETLLPTHLHFYNF